MAVTTARRLLTNSWTEDAEILETAIGRFRADDASRNDCQVVLFEIDRDPLLHVNVTHKYQTKSAPGWAGPANLPQGFVHNRTFGQAQKTDRIVRHVRDMIFAAPA